MLEGMLCMIFDIDRFKRVRKPILTGVLCGFCFIVGLIFTTGEFELYFYYFYKCQLTQIFVWQCGLKIGAGEYWLKMFDSFAGTLGLVVVAFMEMIAVVYVYGHKK